jgi:hypothetical protein
MGLGAAVSPGYKGGTHLMLLNLTFDPSVTSAPIGIRTEFEAAVQAVADYYDALFTNPVTVNIHVGYGKLAEGTSASQDISPSDSGESLIAAIGRVGFFGPTVSYAQLRAALEPTRAALGAFLPNTQPNTGGRTLQVAGAEQKALGLNTGTVGANNPAVDGYVGFSTVIPFDYNVSGGPVPNPTTVPSNQEDFLGVVENEFSDIMGRGSLNNGIGSDYTPMDLYRFAGAPTSSGIGTVDHRQFTTAGPSYFSLNDGSNNLADWNNYQTGHAGDLGAWATSTPTFTSNVGPDAFGDGRRGTPQLVSATDITLLEALGWTISTTPSPSPPPPSGTTADMILRRSDGSFRIYNIGNNAILAGLTLGRVGSDRRVVGIGNFSGTDRSDLLLRDSAGTFQVYDVKANNGTTVTSLGNVGTEWQVAGLGDFNGDGTSDMMLRNTKGTFEIYDINANSVTSATSLGNVGTEWRVAGFGDFNGDGTTDMMLRNTAGTFEVYDINANRVTAATVLGNVGNEWKVAGFGDFNSDGTTDMLLRNTIGTFEIYDINANRVTSATVLGNVGNDWQVAGFGAFNGDGTTDMLLRNGAGTFEVYDISANQVTSASSLGNVGTDWKIAGIANNPAAQFSRPAVDGAHSQFVQAMGGFSQDAGLVATSPIGLASSDPIAPSAMLAAHPVLGNHA